MALKATIHKAQVAIADMDRQLYADHQLTLARHPSETDERMMIRLLAFALNVPASDTGGMLEPAKGLWDPDEPELWMKDLSGRILQWIEVGQPEDKRLMKACPRSERVSVYSFSHSTPIWWKGIESKLFRARNLNVWQVPAADSQALAALASRNMQLQVTVQDGQVWVGNGSESVQVNLQWLGPGQAPGS